MNNENTEFLFTIIKGNNIDSGADLDLLKRDKIFFILNQKLTTILSHLTKIPKNKIILNERFSNELYSVLYKNSTLDQLEVEKE